jgi:chromosome segregation ATPase
MQATLQKEMEEDEKLYNKLKCWCNNNEYEKTNAIEDSEAKITELNSTIESLSAKKAELSSRIKGLDDEVAANRAALSEATAIRDKELQEFHGSEVDSVQAIENLKAAITVLSKHHSAAFPQLSQVSFLGLGKKGLKSEPSALRSLDEFMRKNNLLESTDAAPRHLRAVHHHDGTATDVAPGWSTEEVQLVRGALTSATALVQRRIGYFPSYTSQSGEIFGVLKQLKEDLEGDLSEAQKLEMQRAAAFAQMREAKEEEIAKGEAMAEKKEDELATASNLHAEAKEDFAEETTALQEAQKFMANLQATCAEADENFEKRTKVRTEEMKAVSETISILQEDAARDAMSGTYSLLQWSSSANVYSSRQKKELKNVAANLRRVAAATNDPNLAMLATKVELDAFTKVKKAIDDMIEKLKVQQADEVKKSDYCSQRQL